MTDSMTAGQAAAHLEVSRQRVRKLLESGLLHALSSDPLILSRSEVEEFAHVQSWGRPVFPATAWDEIHAFRRENFSDEADLDRWRRKMRPRARRIRLHMHRSVIAEVISSPLIVASGLHAAAFHGIPVEPDDSRFVGYLAESDREELPEGLPVTVGNDWNVELGVVPDNAWRFGRSARHADAVTTWLDLEDGRFREARLMLEVVLAARN